MSGVKSNNTIGHRMERLFLSRPDDWMSVAYLAMMFGCAESTVKEALLQIRQRDSEFVVERDQVYRVRRKELAP